MGGWRFLEICKKSNYSGLLNDITGLLKEYLHMCEKVN